MKLEDLKVGQYVRFKDKRGNTYIRNIKEVCNEQPHKSWGAIIIDKNANNVPYVSLKNIIKASFDIIDLIEVGDVFKFKELRTYISNKSNTKYYENYIFDVHNEEELEVIKKEIAQGKIKLLEILTKEQMEQMAYKVGE